MHLIKEVAQNGLMWFKPVRNIAKRSHSTGPRDDPEKAMETYTFYTSHPSASVKNRAILELGPGQTVEVLELALRDGAKSCSAVDILQYFSQEKMANFGINYRIYNGRYLPYEADGFDRVWASKVFQHLRYPQTSLREIHRVLVPGGILACRVDLRDPYHLKDERLWVDCLKHRQRAWNAMKWNRASYVNRLRSSEWTKLFKEEGFEEVRIVMRTSAILKEQYQKTPYLQRYSEADVEIFAFDGLYRKS